MLHRKAFTLIELMIVMIIVAILAAAAVPIYSSLVARAYEAEILSALSTVRTAQRAYKAENAVYPTAMGNLTGGDHPYLASGDFADMKYVAWAHLSVDSGGSGESTWTDATKLGGKYPFGQVDLSATGAITRT